MSIENENEKASSRRLVAYSRTTSPRAQTSHEPTHSSTCLNKTKSPDPNETARQGEMICNATSRATELTKLADKCNKCRILRQTQWFSGNDRHHHNCNDKQTDHRFQCRDFGQLGLLDQTIHKQKKKMKLYLIARLDLNQRPTMAPCPSDTLFPGGSHRLERCSARFLILLLYQLSYVRQTQALVKGAFELGHRDCADRIGRSENIASPART